MLVLDTHDTTTPLSGQVGVVIELSLEHGGHLFEVNNILAADISDSDAGGGLEVAELSKVGLSTDEAEGDTLLAAESGKMDDKLDGVDVVGNDDKLGLVLLDERGNVVQTELKVDRLGSLVLTTVLSFFLQAFLLVLSGFGAVFGEQFKELGSYIKYLLVRTNLILRRKTDTTLARAMGAEWKMLAHTLVLLDSVGELVDGGGHLQSLH